MSASSIDPALPTLPAWMQTQEAPSPKQVGRYAIEGRLGEGGMGVVFAGRDPVLDRRVAVKVLRGADDERRGAARMVREAQALAKLSHPNVVPVFEAGEVDGLFFLAMELVEGRTLQEAQRDPDLPWDVGLGFYLQAGEGLAAAHAAGFVHRDFKPSNVLVGDDGRVKVVDFGLARPVAEATESAAVSVETSGVDDKLTRTGSQVGTPAYMSPEQRVGDPVDARSDQFSFCAAAWEWLFGVNPARAIVRASVEARDVEFPRPNRTPSVPATTRDALRRGLQVQPGRRWPDMATLLAKMRPRASARGRWIAAAAIATAAGVAWVAATDDPCATIEQAAPFDGTAVHGALAAADPELGPTTADAVTPGLTSWAASMAAAQLTSCRARADGSITADRHAAESRCFDQRQARFDALTAELLTGTGPAVRGAVEAFSNLPSSAACREAGTLDAAVPPPDDPEVAATVAAARVELARVATRVVMQEDVDDALDALQEDADATEYAPFGAEVRLLRGRLAQRRARYVDAVEHFRAAYELAEASGHDVVAAQASAWILTTVALRLGGPGVARPWAAVAKAKAERVPGVAEVQTFVPLALGFLAEADGDATGARSHYEQALQLRRATYGEEHPRVGDTIEALAILARGTGDGAEARARFEDVLARRIRTFGEAHPIVARARVNLALLRSDAGELEAARTDLEAALADLRRGGSEPGVEAVVVGVIADLHHRQDAYEVAAGRYREAIALAETAAGQRGLMAASLRAELAAVECNRGRYTQAHELASASLAVFEAAYGRDNPALGFVLNNLGIAQQNLGRLAEAKATYGRALQIRRARLGPRHRSLSAVLVNLGSIALEQGALEEAKTYLLDGLSIDEEVLGTDHPDNYYTLFYLGQVAAQEGDKAEAARRYEEALKLRELSDVARTELKAALAGVRSP